MKQQPVPEVAKKPDEVQPLNGSFLDFDLGKVEIEELERRFEMALALPPIDTSLECGCPNLRSCNVYCVPPP